jgi:hypothetical protein
VSQLKRRKRLHAVPLPFALCLPMLAQIRLGKAVPGVDPDQLAGAGCEGCLRWCLVRPGASSCCALCAAAFFSPCHDAVL